MKIRQLKIDGFRSLRQVEWTPGDLNVVIGPNGSGKSNLLLALELLSASAAGQLSEFVRRAGGMEPLAWDGSEAPIAFELITDEVDAVEEDKLFKYFLHLNRLGRSSNFVIGYELLDTSPSQQGSSVETVRLFRNPVRSELWDDEAQKFHSITRKLAEAESLLSEASGPLAISSETADFQSQVAKWRLYQDFRTDREAPVRQPALARLETQVSPDGSDLVAALHTLYSTQRRFEEDVDQGMSVAFGEDYDRLVFPPSADGRVQLRLRWKSLQRESTTAELSDGTLRFLYLLTILSNPNPPPLIAIDEPETGLHPGMLEIVAEYISNAALRTQLIVTTHSAELLDTLTPFRPTITIATWQDGETKLHVADDKNLEYWLQEYTLGRLFRTGELEAVGVVV